MITEVKALSGGACRHLLAVIDRKTWKVVDFPAVFLALHHATEGWILVDASYGAGFAAATEPFPQRFYRWVTPVATKGSVAGVLAQAGVRPEEIRHVVMTHFHADHVGGLSEFPQAQIHYHEEALAPLLRLPAWRQVRAAFLAELVPGWLGRQAKVIPRDRFTLAADLPFPVCDLFGDGSVRLPYLPGHAPGQVGVAFQWRGRRRLYAADAYWREDQITSGVDPLPMAMWIQWDAKAYRSTVRALRGLNAQGGWEIVACHDGSVCERWSKEAGRG